MHTRDRITISKHSAKNGMVYSSTKDVHARTHAVTHAATQLIKSVALKGHQHHIIHNKSLELNASCTRPCVIRHWKHHPWTRHRTADRPIVLLSHPSALGPLIMEHRPHVHLDTPAGGRVSLLTIHTSHSLVTVTSQWIHGCYSMLLEENAVGFGWEEEGKTPPLARPVGVVLAGFCEGSLLADPPCVLF